MSSRNKEAIALVFDTGKTAVADPTFFEKSKQCLSRILERKILLHSVDCVCIILVGSEDSEENYNHVSCPFNLQLPSWEMVRFVRNKITPTMKHSDWLTGVVLAADKLAHSFSKNKKIVVLSNLASSTSIKDTSVISDHLKMMELTITLIGPENLREMLEETEVPHKRSKMGAPELSAESKQFLIELWDKLDENLEIAEVEQALQHLTEMPMKQTKSKAWNCELSIADVKIPISAYVKIKKSVKKPMTRMKCVIEKEESMGSVEPPTILQRVLQKSYVDQEGVNVVVTPEETTKGVKYGNTLLPYTDADKKAMEYKAGPKGIRVLFFTKLALLNRMFVMGDGCHVVVAPKDDSAGSIALSALIQALQKMERGAIARKVYSTDRGLRLVLLSPIREKVTIDGEEVFKECLVMNDLVWKEGVKEIPFQETTCHITKIQQNAVDTLVDLKNLMTAEKDLHGEPKESFKVENLREEKNSYYLQCLVERAINPNAPLPKSSFSHHKDISWSNEVAETLDEIKKQFPITRVAEKNDKKEFFRQRYLQEMKNPGEMLPPPAPLPKLDHPKPVINDNDVDCVRDVKVLFADHILPPGRALIYTLKNNVFDPDNKPVLLASVKDCIIELNAFARSVEYQKYDNWFDNLFEISPDLGGIAEFVSSLRGQYGSIHDDVKETEAEEISSCLRDAADFERSQILMDIF